MVILQNEIGLLIEPNQLQPLLRLLSEQVALQSNEDANLCVIDLGRLP